jgi:hypothetical protein
MFGLIPYVGEYVRIHCKTGVAKVGRGVLMFVLTPNVGGYVCIHCRISVDEVRFRLT